MGSQRVGHDWATEHTHKWFLAQGPSRITQKCSLEKSALNPGFKEFLAYSFQELTATEQGHRDGVSKVSKTANYRIRCADFGSWT